MGWRWLIKMEKEQTKQAVKGYVVCLKQTNLPILVVIGNLEKAKDYIKEDTSFPIEQFSFMESNIVI
jgi:hypothetical protein